MQKLSNVNDKDRRSDFSETVPNRCYIIYNNMIQRDLKVFANSDNANLFEELWYMDAKGRIKPSGKKKADGKARYKDGAYKEAFNRLEMATKYIEYDSSFREEMKTQTKALEVTCSLNIASCKLKLENKNAEKCCFIILEDFQDQLNQKESFTYMVLKSQKTKGKIVLVENKLVHGESYMRMTGLKSLVDKEKEEIYVRELLEAYEALPLETLEETEALFLSMYKSFSFVSYRPGRVASSWFWHDVTLVFDPGGIINHFALHLDNILVCKGFKIVVHGGGDKKPIGERKAKNIDALKATIAAVAEGMVPGWECYKIIFNCSTSLRTRMFSRGMDCNGPSMYMGLLLLHLGRLIYLDYKPSPLQTNMSCYI